MPWIYSISKHTFSYPGLPDASDGIYCGGGIAPFHNPLLVNNPGACNETNLGPLPPGTWIMESIADDPKTGPETIVLVPDAGTTKLCQSLNRGPMSFRIHGDSLANPGQGSEGCIVAPRDFRVNVLWGSADKEIIVVP